MVEACSHGRSWLFFAESLHSDATPFVAHKCKTYDIFMGQRRECGETALMGDATPVDTRGRFYLNTDDKAPFARVI